MRREVSPPKSGQTSCSPLARLAASSAAKRRERSVRGPCFSAQGGAGASWIPANADGSRGRTSAPRGRCAVTAASPLNQPSDATTSGCCNRRGGATPHRGTSLIPVLRRGSGRVRLFSSEVERPCLRAIRGIEDWRGTPFGPHGARRCTQARLGGAWRGRRLPGSTLLATIGATSNHPKLPWFRGVCRPQPRRPKVPSEEPHPQRALRLLARRQADPQQTR